MASSANASARLTTSVVALAIALVHSTLRIARSMRRWRS
jgi:hypothetical protein